jgi:hypothetical protein
VLAVTTDNASNNKTLVDSLHHSIEALNLPDSTRAVRIPCLAHVIQLSLKDLLGLMKANPNNDTTDTVWSEEENKSALEKARSEKGIIYTLAKVSYLDSILKYTHTISRSVVSQFTSTLAPNDGSSF